MLCGRSLLLLLVNCLLSASMAGQQTARSQTVQQDPQAVLVLTRASNTAGEEVHGSFIVKGRGTGQFRLDAALPDGVRSWAMNSSTGFVRNPDGTVWPVGYDNTVNSGSLTFPYAYLAMVLGGSLTC
jgi:hypothetical protein